MELRGFKNISEQDSFLHLIDGRVKTVIFLGAIIVGTCLTRWYLVSILWMLSIAMFPVLHLPLEYSIKAIDDALWHSLVSFSKFNFYQRK